MSNILKCVQFEHESGYRYDLNSPHMSRQSTDVTVHQEYSSYPGCNHFLLDTGNHYYPPRTGYSHCSLEGGPSPGRHSHLVSQLETNNKNTILIYNYRLIILI